MIKQIGKKCKQLINLDKEYMGTYTEDKSYPKWKENLFLIKRALNLSRPAQLFPTDGAFRAFASGSSLSSFT